MLENEGFRYECYVDVFDGGPTTTATTDAIATIKAARTAKVVGLVEDDNDWLVAGGKLVAFRAAAAASQSRTRASP